LAASLGFASSAFFSASGALTASAAGLVGSSFLAQPTATITEVANNSATNRTQNLRILNAPPFLNYIPSLARKKSGKIFLPEIYPSKKDTNRNWNPFGILEVNKVNLIDNLQEVAAKIQQWN
jgi:hypothetical protein